MVLWGCAELPGEEDIRQFSVLRVIGWARRGGGEVLWWWRGTAGGGAVLYVVLLVIP